MQNKTILFYNDSDVVGGHELLTIRIINALADNLGVNIHFAYHSPEISQHLSNRVTTSSLPFHSKSLKLHHSSKLDFQFVKQLAQDVKPDLAVISQGYIESGFRGVIGCRMAGIKTGSYIPFGNTNRELGNKFAQVRDIAAKPIYALNQFYITISAYQERMLKRLTSSKPTHLINNPVTYQHSSPKAPQSISKDSQQKLQIALIGRVIFKQKNQNRLIPVAQQLLNAGTPVHFHIIGDGPDKTSLEMLAANHKVSNAFTFHNWLSKPEIDLLLSNTIDAVILPSHYEGLPLALLESIHHGKPVIISDMPFIEDYQIPECYIINPNSTESICNKISELRNIDNEKQVRELQDKIRMTNSFERFNQDIENTFSSLLSIN